MITERDLLDAIAECQEQRNPTASTCIKLAAFYTIRREMYGEEKDAVQLPSGYSLSPAPDPITETKIINSGETEFAKAINGREQAEIWPLMDEMMDTIQAIHPRLYRAVMERLR